MGGIDKILKGPSMELEVAIEKTNQPKPRPSDENYGFGRYFSDHMFMVEYSDVLKWHAPRIMPYQSLRLDPGAAVLHYGQAIFEGMKAFRGDDGKVRLFRPEMNWKRMKASADRLCMQMPGYDVFLEGLTRLVKTDSEWVPKAQQTALYLRPTLIGTEAFLGVRPAEGYLFYVIGSPVGSYYGGDGLSTVKIWVERHFSRAAPGGVGAAKAGGNYAASLMAARDAKKRGYAQVLWLDACQKKYVEEVGTMNVFFRIGNTVITPPLGGTILPGITRDSAIKILEGQGVRVEQRPLSIDEIIGAHDKGELLEVFGTGTAASISPVGALGLEDRILTINEGRVGEVSTNLFKSITDIQYGRTPDSFGWTVEISNSR